MENTKKPNSPLSPEATVYEDYLLPLLNSFNITFFTLKANIDLNKYLGNNIVPMFIS